MDRLYLHILLYLGGRPRYGRTSRGIDGRTWGVTKKLGYRGVPHQKSSTSVAATKGNDSRIFGSTYCSLNRKGIGYSRVDERDN